MTQHLPPNLLALFAPRDPIPFIPPIEKHKTHRKLPYTGIAQFLGEFEDPSETPAPPKVETREERKARKRKEKQEQANYKLERDLALWNPKKLTTGTTNAYNTLFVARLNYDTSEQKLRREFDVYGPIKKVCLVKDGSSGKPKGYAFVEFEHERDMHAANKDANGRKIDGHRVLTDVERGRTRPDWRPRRLGKGLGKSRSGPSEPKREEKRRDDDRDKDRDRRKRSRSREYRDRRRRSRSHERKRSRDRSRDHGRREKYRREEMSQYGEYGAEIKAEYNGDY